MNVFARRSSGTLIGLGVLAVLFGIVAAFWPVGTALGLVILWGVYALVDGVAALAFAFSARTAPGRGLLLLSGVLGVLVGLLLVFRPFSGQVALAWLVGAWLIVRGLLEFGGAFGGFTVRPRWLLALGGLAWVIAGVVFVTHPGVAVLTFSWMLAVLAMLWGALLIAAGVSLRSAADRTEGSDIVL